MSQYQLELELGIKPGHLHRRPAPCPLGAVLKKHLVSHAKWVFSDMVTHRWLGIGAGWALMDLLNISENVYGMFYMLKTDRNSPYFDYGDHAKQVLPQISISTTKPNKFDHARQV